MELEKLFNQQFLYDLSFFNFENAITATYFADADLNIIKVNKNFKSLFNDDVVLEGQNLLTLLGLLDVAQSHISEFKQKLNKDGKLLIHKIKIIVGDEERYFTLASTRTSSSFSNGLIGVQGQLIDRTNEVTLQARNEELLLENEKAFKELSFKTERLEKISNQLAKYLSPQIYKNIFETDTDKVETYTRKKLTVFFSDIKEFTSLSDTLDPDLLAEIINEYLSEMTEIALHFGGTIDKFIGDAILIFFGDPETEGTALDAEKCVNMAIAMRKRVGELDEVWKKEKGITQGLQVRTGISTGYCTVGNFGSVQRVDYTVLGSPVNLAARLEAACGPQEILVSPETKSLVEKVFEFEEKKPIKLKGFSESIKPYQLIINDQKEKTVAHSLHSSDTLDVIVKRPDDLEKILKELKSIQDDYRAKLGKQAK
ncbi:MAG: adenylate/guanylate cyclase domain-containing protein [Pseudomonadota bacterium]|nr:adenylate/guanylate cyclase domain-containing protein [Pseudomonadota bacterium]